MKRFTRLRPSPAMVVATIALFVALGGVGYAAATIGSAQIKNNAVTSKDIKNRTIGKKDINNKALAGLKGAKGDTGAPGAPGAPGANGTAVAYAYVNSDGTVDAALSKGITSANVSKDGVGFYCFSGMAVAPKSVTTQLGYDSPGVVGAGGTTRASVGDAGFCDALGSAEQAAVAMNTDGSGAGEDHGFFVVFN